MDRFACGSAGVLVAALVVARLVATGDPFDQMWAEDGVVFLGRGHQVDALVEGYAGYAHLLPRILGAIGALLPVSWWAAYAVVAAAGVVGCLGATAWFAAWCTTRSARAAWVAALSFAALPALRLESLGSIANLQWFLLAAVAWVFWLPADRGRAVALVVAGAAAGSSPAVVLLLPVLIARHGTAVVRAPATWGLLLGGLYQVGVVILGPVTPGGPVRESGVPADAVAVFLDHAGGTGSRVPGAGLVVLAGLLALAVAGVLRGDTARPLVVLTAVTGAVVVVALSVVTGAVASRYVAGGLLLVTVGAAVGVGLGGHWVTSVLAALAVVAVVAAPADTIKFVGPSWSVGVQAWRAGCSAGATSVPIPVSPPGWGALDLACPG